ncbi:MAG: electron transfer flavoprotein subunit alpha/FixB family protein [Desulfovibrio sp.]|uniref:electron transfer flavoprotein subunit alpha/FixB family protein n=1 Tax=Desulfovibrio sp. 7SRBS1 TaxID=3378064 RepID=UPI003B3FA972
MDKILYIAAVEQDGALSKTSLEALGATTKLAGELGADFDVALFGKDVQAAADSLAGCGAQAVLGVSGEEFAQARYGTDAAAMQALVVESGATVVLACADSRISRVAAGVAQRLGGRVDTFLTDISGENGQVNATRWFYRQRMKGVLTRTERPWVLTIAPGSFEAAATQPGQADVKTVAVELPGDAVKTTVKCIQSPDADQQTIRPDAELLLVAGAGWTKKQDGAVRSGDAETLILSFLNNTKCSLGSSKSLVDISGEGEAVLSFMSHLHQVGQTGATPRHKKGLATCCHGEEPHVVGWRFITERRAVNTDANCGWAQGKADVLYVADAFAVMNKVNELLSGE